MLKSNQQLTRRWLLRPIDFHPTQVYSYLIHQEYDLLVAANSVQGFIYFLLEKVTNRLGPNMLSNLKKKQAKQKLFISVFPSSFSFCEIVNFFSVIKDRKP